MPNVRLSTVLLAVLSCVLAPPLARAATWYVAATGVDAPDCGRKTNPCRSICRAIGQPSTVAGDKIVVGPGRYGDVDGNGTLGGPGDEAPAPGCGCMLAVNKGVSLISSHGAAATVIDGRFLTGLAANVALFMDGGEFGRPGKGFTVTPTGDLGSHGLVIDSGNIAVRGNQIVNASEPGLGTGIRTVAFPQAMRIEGNQAIGWEFGMFLRGGNKTVRDNQVSQNRVGMIVEGGTVVGNLALANTDVGFLLREATDATGNAAHGNRWGFQVGLGFSGALQKNDVFGNILCGLLNGGIGTTGPLPDLAAPKNYWGAATGPGPAPADDVCGTATTTPFATKPFGVKPRLKL